MGVENVLVALSDPTRRSIVERLRKRPQRVADIAADMPVSRPAVSQHLKVLREAGLVWVERKGTARVYHVDPGALIALRRYLDGFWGDVLDAFEKQFSDRREDDDR